MKPRAAVFVLSLWAVAVCCSREPPGARWFDSVQESSGLAEERLAAGDVAGAREALDAGLAVPPAGAPSEDVRLVHRDLLYRLAMLDLESKRFAEARQGADRGLAFGRETNVFTANLLVVRGKALEGEGDASGASRDYHEALLINERLLGAALTEESEGAE
jgi:hypothetical protein